MIKHIDLKKNKKKTNKQHVLSETHWDFISHVLTRQQMVEPDIKSGNTGVQSPMKRQLRPVNPRRPVLLRTVKRLPT